MSPLLDVEWRIGIDLACYVFGKEPRLEFKAAPVAGCVAKQGMVHLFVQPLFQFGKEDLAPLLLQTLRSQLDDKTISTAHAMTEHTQDHRIHHDWPESFHQIEHPC